jgi:hypothetical protein
VCFRSSFVHQGGLSEGTFRRLLSCHLLLLMIHIWSLIVPVCSLERRTKVQDAPKYNQSLPSVGTFVAFVDKHIILDHVRLSRGCAIGIHLYIFF